MTIEFDLPIKSRMEADAIRTAIYKLAEYRLKGLAEHREGVSEWKLKRWRLQRNRCGDVLNRLDKCLKLAQAANSVVAEEG